MISHWLVHVNLGRGKRAMRKKKEKRLKKRIRSRRRRRKGWKERGDRERER